MYRGTLDAVSNREDFLFIRQIVDDDTNEPIDLTLASMTFAIREQAGDQSYGAPAVAAPLLIATTDNGKITLVDIGTFQVWFTASDMSGLSSGFYEVGCTVTVNGITKQLIAAELPVIDGVVSL